MAVQCFKTDIYLKLLLKLHISLKQCYIYMLNQELDMLSGLLNRDLKSDNRNAVHWRPGGEGRREELGIIRACHRVWGLGMFPFTFDSLIILIEKLHRNTKLENWSAPEGPTQWLPSLCHPAIPVSRLFSGGGVAKHTSCPPTLLKIQMAACRCDVLFLYLEINAWYWEPEGRRHPTSTFRHPSLCSPVSECHKSNQCMREILCFQSWCTIKITHNSSS